MKCPSCCGEMHPGRASVELSGLGMVLTLFRGGSAPHYLYFRPNGDGGQAGWVEPLDQAFRCPRCLTLVVAGEELAGGPLPGSDDEASARNLITEIDGLLARGDSQGAVRRYREVTGARWDKVHDAVGRWTKLPPEHRLAVIAGAISKNRARPAAAAQNPAAQNPPTQ